MMFSLGLWLRSMIDCMLLDRPDTTSVGRTLIFTSKDLPWPLALGGDRRTPLILVVLLGASWAGATGSAPSDGPAAWGT